MKKFGWAYRPDPVGTRCSASLLGLASRTRSSASLPLNFFTASGVRGEGAGHRLKALVMAQRSTYGTGFRDRLQSAQIPLTPSPSPALGERGADSRDCGWMKLVEVSR